MHRTCDHNVNQIRVIDEDEGYSEKMKAYDSLISFCNLNGQKL